MKCFHGNTTTLSSFSTRRSTCHFSKILLLLRLFILVQIWARGPISNSQEIKSLVVTFTSIILMPDYDISKVFFLFRYSKQGLNLKEGLDLLGFTIQLGLPFLLFLLSCLRTILGFRYHWRSSIHSVFSSWEHISLKTSWEELTLLE